MAAKTFLEICQDVASDSGTFRDSALTSVSSQTGRNGKVVRWVKKAWTTIQTSRRDWQWMVSTFSGNTVASDQAMTGADLTGSSRFGNWVCRRDHTEDRFSIYDTTVGQSGEGRIFCIEWNEFWVRKMRGVAPTGIPTSFSISPDNQIYFSPTPDAATYVVRGLFRKSPQVLSDGSDEPEMPWEFHDLITEVALHYLANHDESYDQLQAWKLMEFSRYHDLVGDQSMKWAETPVFA